MQKLAATSGSLLFTLYDWHLVLVFRLPTLLFIIRSATIVADSYRECFCTTSINIVLTRKYQLTEKKTHLKTMLQFSLSTSGRCSSLRLQWASCGTYIDVCNILYMQIVIPWYNTKYYDFPSKNFSYNWRWCKKHYKVSRLMAALLSVWTCSDSKNLCQ